MTKMFELDMRGLAKGAQKLERIKREALPHAARNSLNRMAFDARKDLQKRMGKTMTLRNTWTTRSVMVDKATGTNMMSMESRVGSVQPYVAMQEDGGTVSSKGRHGVTIPTPTASGEGMSANPRKRLVRKANWLSAIRLPPSGRVGAGSRQRNAIAVTKAIKSGARVAFLDLGTRKGIARIIGGGRSAKVRMVWDMSKRSVRIKPRPMLEPTMKAMQRRAPRIAEAEALKQIKRALKR